MVAPQVMALVDEIRRRGLSRNKHFALFARQDYREARRIQRYLDSLARELERLADKGELELSLRRAEEDDRFVLSVYIRRLGLVRRCYLAEPELGYLEAHHPTVARCIADGRDAPLSCLPKEPSSMQTRGDDCDA